MSEARRNYGGKPVPQESVLEIHEAAAVRSHFDLRVFQAAKRSAMEIFHLSKSFPKEELFALTGQIRRSSRSVATSITEAWKRRRYPAAFVERLNLAEAEAGETQTWLDFAQECGYLKPEEARRMIQDYEAILSTLSAMQLHSDSWTRTFARKPARHGQSTSHNPQSTSEAP